MARIALCDVRGLLVDTIEKLSGEDGSYWAERLKPALRKNDILWRVTEVTVGPVNKFVAAESFQFIEGNSACIVRPSEDFKTIFLGKIEKDVKAATLIVSRLEKRSFDFEIIKEIGLKRKETTLAHLYNLLKKQSRGEPGILLNGGYANTFYIHAANRKLWSVNAFWNADGGDWIVHASSIESLHERGEGSQIFYCK